MADALCLKFQEKILNAEQSISCSGCEYSYHCGVCAGVSEVTLKTKGEAYRKTWKCPTCRVSRLKGGAVSKQKPDDDILISILLAGMNEKLDELLNLKETVGSIEASISMMSAQYDEILKSVNEQKKEMKEVKSRLAEIEKKDQEEEVKKLKAELNDMEWRSRKLNLEFHGITKSNDEDLISKVNEVARTLEVPELAGCDITAIHRLPSKPDKIPSVIVRFASQTTRDAWLYRKNKLRATGMRVYIYENMTKQNRELLAKTKEWAKANGFQYTWHRN